MTDRNSHVDEPFRSILNSFSRGVTGSPRLVEMAERAKTSVAPRPMFEKMQSLEADDYYRDMRAVDAVKGALRLCLGTVGQCAKVCASDKSLEVYAEFTNLLTDMLSDADGLETRIGEAGIARIHVTENGVEDV